MLETCFVNEPNTRDTFRLALPTPAGELRAEIAVPTQLIPVSDIVPVMRSLSEQALALEVEQRQRAGQTLSCHKGCAACCRMLVPVSPPEAFALKEAVEQLPETQRDRILHRLATLQRTLTETGLLGRLVQLSETRTQLSDEDMEPVNRDYYARRLPCAFLDDDECSLYDARPAACRELLVTSPAEWCREMDNKPVRTVPVPFRIGTALSLLWATMTGGAARLIPLPVALDWAERHAGENSARHNGATFLQMGMEKILGLLRHKA